MTPPPAPIKLIASAVVVGLLYAAAWFAAGAFMATAAIPDQGSRGLIVVSTSGSDRDYNLNVRQFVRDDGSIKLVTYFTSPNTTLGKEGNTKAIRFSISFVGEIFDRQAASERVTCGKSTDPIPRLAFGDLPLGTQGAILTDAVATHNSALREKSASADETKARVRAGRYPEWGGTLWLLNDGEWRNRREEFYAEECVLPASSAWRTSTGGNDWLASGRSLLPPQINFTAQGEKTDYQQSLYSEVIVARAKGQVLIDGFPRPETKSDEWHYQSKQYWMGKKGSTSNIGYTDQPVWLFSDRQVGDRRALALLAMGALLGMAGSMTIALLSGVADTLWRQWQKRLKDLQ